jgi:hypothetical protein
LDDVQIEARLLIRVGGEECQKWGLG